MDNILNSKYDFIFSIGEACSCTSILRINDLQFQSYPLDWLYGGNIKTRTDCICNDFKDFINVEDLVKIGERENPCPCDIYLNAKNQIVFNHDFELHKNLADIYPAVKEKYDRRIKRLYNNIQDANSILIVYVDVPSRTIKTFKTIPLIKQCFNDIKNKIPNKNIKLLYIGHKNWFIPIKIKFKLSKDIMLVMTNYRSKAKLAETWEVDVNVLSQIVKGIELNRK